MPGGGTLSRTQIAFAAVVAVAFAAVCLVPFVTWRSDFSGTTMAAAPSEFMTEVEPLSGGGSLLRFHRRNRRALMAVTFAEAMGLLRSSDPGFIATLSEALRDSTFPAVFWEHPPFSAATANSQYEFVLNPATQLESTPADPATFAEKLRLDHEVATFPNLRGDAMLVAPVQQAGIEEATYAHLKTFLQHAPANQQRALFAAIGEAMQMHAKRSEEPVWLSTSGLGVAWLHVRLDVRPKYYTHGPYKARVN